MKPLTDAKVDDKTFRILSLIAVVEWLSSRLAEDNAFTAAMFIRTCGLVAKHGGVAGEEFKKIVRKKDDHCRDSRPGPFNEQSVAKIAEALLGNPEEALIVENYPATSTLGYWLVDAIDTLDIQIDDTKWRKVAAWANNEFMRQASLVSARHDAMMDPIAMAMAACMLARLVKIAKAKRLRLGEGDFKLFPSSAQLLFGIRELFALQGHSGIWPKYFPLFHYPDAGANYCFSFEMLEAILAEFGPHERDEIEAPDMLEEEKILEGLELAVQWCEQNRLEFTVPDGTIYRGWNSGGQIKTLSRGMPESWATGVVHMFLSRLRESLSRSIQRRILRLASVATINTRRPDPSEWDNLIDMQLEIQGQPQFLKEVIDQTIIMPLQVEGRITPQVRRSALLFGPPGTSKTSIVKALAKKVGWPFLEINPAHFLNEGLERIYVRADELFEDLMDLSGVVVLFDEMDALVQKRKGENESTERLDVTRQFLTTSMLPKLSKLYERGGVLFFMATNYQSEFDEAIKRPRRFDLLLCMAPPSWKAKVKRLDLFLKSPQYNLIEDADKEYAVKKLIGWAETGNVEKLLDLFSFDETRVFLEDFFQGRLIREVLDDQAHQASFTSKVHDWASKYITLRESGSVYKVYMEKDRSASRIQ